MVANAQSEAELDGHLRIFQVPVEQVAAFFEPVDDCIAVDEQALCRFGNLAMTF